MGTTIRDNRPALQRMHSEMTVTNPAWRELNSDFKNEAKGSIKMGQWLRVLSFLGVEWS